jgi:2-methylisocitrate lyase-like PEP mutase family enzyme
MPSTLHADMHARFLALHRAESPLLIANAWDAASASLWRHAGATAIATSSAALDWACGYADGGALPREALLQKVHDIVRVAAVPVSIDVEDGYSNDPQAVAALVREVAGIGAVGINLEDGGGEPDLLVAKIEAIRAALGDTPLFINARTDVYLRGMAAGEAAVNMTVERLARFARAGADGAFVPGIVATDEIAAVASRTTLPLNVMTVPGLAPLAELQQAGVRRISVGPALFQHAFAAGLQATRQFLAGDIARGLGTAMPYAELNALFAPKR